jgi:hypothetical protein
VAYKVFTNGSTLQASEVNENLMQQSVATFSNQTARDAAITSPVQGQVTYIEDSSSYQSFDGTTWIGLVPQSRNAIINGGFDFWQRGTSLSSATGLRFLADRFKNDSVGSTYTVSRQAFTPGEVNAFGFGDAAFYLRSAVTSVAGSGNYAFIDHAIEDVKTFAGQTVTLSFWAKADSSKNIAFEINQVFNSSAVVRVNPGKQSITSTWTRYTVTFDVPSIVGKTIGASSYLQIRIWLDAGSTFNARTDTLGQQNITFDVWGVQLEAGSVATPFRRNANSLQGELAGCQRYYFRPSSGTAFWIHSNGHGISSTAAYVYVKTPVTARINTTAVEFSSLALSPFGAAPIAVTSLTIDQAQNDIIRLQANVASGLTINENYALLNNNNINGFLGFTWEL